MGGAAMKQHVILERKAVEAFPKPKDVSRGGPKVFETESRTEGIDYVAVLIISDIAGSLEVFESNAVTPLLLARTRDPIATVATVDQDGNPVNMLEERISTTGQVTRLRYTNGAGVQTLFRFAADMVP